MSFACGRFQTKVILTALLAVAVGLPVLTVARAADDQPVKKPLSENELLRKRILESLAGIRDPQRRPNSRPCTGRNCRTGKR